MEEHCNKELVQLQFRDLDRRFMIDVLSFNFFQLNSLKLIQAIIFFTTNTSF